MEDRPLQFGSGSAQLGGDAGVEALNAAIAARQTGQASPTQAVSPASGSFDPSQIPPQVAGAPAAPTATGAPAPMGMGQSLGMNKEMENQLLIKALDAKLRSNASIEKSMSKGGV